ncbi:MAG: polyisoprenoid-binding protein [Archangium sp.]|nr:polyisoprenoid-binding protein [Archangium sp.]
MAWNIDPVHTHVGFSVKHLMVSTVRGQFKKYAGTLNLDPKDFTKSSFAAQIDVASIDTENKDRDAHLRTNDFFDAANHPLITFTSTRIEAKGGSEYTMWGDLTIRGVTKEVPLAVEFNGTAKSPFGTTVFGLSARGSVIRKDFGVSFNAALETGGVVVGDKVNLEIELEATEVAESVSPQLAAQAAQRPAEVTTRR